MEAYQEAAEMMLNKFQALSDAAVQQVGFTFFILLLKYSML